MPKEQGGCWKTMDMEVVLPREEGEAWSRLGGHKVNVVSVQVRCWTVIHRAWLGSHSTTYAIIPLKLASAKAGER